MIFSTLICLSQGGIRILWKVNNKKCNRHRGYAPGGFEPEIKPISSPVASFDRNALAATAAVTGTSFGAASVSIANGLLTDQTVKEMKKVGKKLAKAFKNVAPVLGPALGIVSALLGFIPGLSSPSPEDILNKVNQGFKKLTDDVNDRLEKMKEYIDYSILTHEKQIMGNEYKELYRRLTICISKPHKLEVNRCVRDAADAIYSKQPKFMPFIDNYFAKKKFVRNPKDTKKLEVSLLVFTQYATLRFLCL